jgi:hypothetical protein
MNSNDSDDLDDIIRQERSRGRSWLSNKDDIKAHRLRVKQYKDILRAMQWKEVVSALGLRKGSKEYDEWKQIWTAYHGDSG